MTQKQINNLAKIYDDLMRMDGFDKAIIGVCIRCGDKPFFIYNHKKVIKILMKGGMTEDEAIEYCNYNQMGAYVGETTPGFLVYGQ